MLRRLPEEIQVDVFLRLPVKSILSCRCVCKPFCKLLYNPEFIKDHLLKQNKKKPRLMFISTMGFEHTVCRSIDYAASILSASSSAPASSLSEINVTCDGAFSLSDYLFARHRDQQDGIQVVGSCKGLVCISISITPSRFCIWNPSASVDCKIISCSFRLLPFRVTRLMVRYGFGYDSQLEDYKLIRIVGNWADGVNFSYSQIEVCTLGSNSCKTIQCMHRYVVLPPCNYHIWLLNGALHWAGFVQTTSSRVIVSFDISSERFVDFLYPEGVFNNRKMRVTYDHVGLLEGHLCLVVHTIYLDKPIDIWLMQDYGVTESWIKQFSIKNTFTFDINAFNFKLVWSSMDGEFLMHTDTIKILYDAKNGSTKVLKIPGLDDMARCELVSYAESLISLGSVSLGSGPTFGLKKYNAKEVTKKQRQK